MPGKVEFSLHSVHMDVSATFSTANETAAFVKEIVGPSFILVLVGGSSTFSSTLSLGM